MKIEYVGRQKPHRERLYGTKTWFSGPGDVQDMDEEIGRKMATNHPDQYAIAGSKAAKPAAPATSEPTEPTEPTETDGPSLDREILVNGAYKALKDCTKKELEVFALEAFEVDLDRRAKVGDLAVQVAGLIDKAEQEG